MSGNVYQWCSDWFGADYYKHSPLSDPSGPTAGSARVLRGGIWSDYASLCRSAFRFNHRPDRRFHHLGFRVVVDIARSPRAALADLTPAVGTADTSESGRPVRLRTAPAAGTSHEEPDNDKGVPTTLSSKTIPETIDTEIQLPRKGGPYKLVGRVTISKSGSLLIERGTMVVASPGAAIIATGQLTSYGDADDFVKFRPQSPMVGWDKLDLEKGTPHALERFDVRGANRGLYIGEDVTGEIKECRFLQNKLGVEIKRTPANSPLLFTNCMIAGNLSDGITFHLSHVKFDHCTIFGNQGIGLDLLYYGNVTAQNCSIGANGVGIMTVIYDTHVDVTSSTITGNRAAAIVVRTEQDLQCKGDYWGTSNRQQIAASIIDGCDSQCR